MSYYKKYIYSILVVKILFVVTAILHFILQFQGKSVGAIDEIIIFWKDRIDFIFTFMMSVLIVYLFYPYHKIPVVLDKETKTLLWLFGIVLIFTANWRLFIGESKIVELSQYVIANVKSKNYMK
uniref:Uncharacterized protein n=1 Tax=viral metagenome TaxID=1070528 RepID=A0A6C0HGQ6_9ZZZZ